MIIISDDIVIFTAAFPHLVSLLVSSYFLMKFKLDLSSTITVSIYTNKMSIVCVCDLFYILRAYMRKEKFTSCRHVEHVSADFDSISFYHSTGIYLSISLAS